MPDKKFHWGADGTQLMYSPLVSTTVKCYGSKLGRGYCPYLIYRSRVSLAHR